MAGRFCISTSLFCKGKQSFLQYLIKVKVGIHVDINCDNKCSSRTQYPKLSNLTCPNSKV